MMNEVWYELVRVAKRGLAAVLFMMLLVGAGAAALSVIALGVSTLSNVHRTTTSTVLPGSGMTSNATGIPVEPPSGMGESWPSGTQPTVTSMDALNERLDHMHSPIGTAIDSGGVVLGEHIHETFGRFLSGLLRTLFIEQPDTRGGAGS